MKHLACTVCIFLLLIEIDASTICPYGENTVFLDSFSDMGLTEIRVGPSATLQEKMKSSKTCFSFCKSSLNCSIAHFHQATKSCYTLSVEEKNFDHICDNSTETTLTCSEPRACKNFVKICKECGSYSAFGLVEKLHCSEDFKQGFSSVNIIKFCSNVHVNTPVKCPFGQEIQYFDYKSDLDWTFVKLNNFYEKLEENSSETCFKRCTNQESCFGAVFHSTFSWCYISKVTLRSIFHLCTAFNLYSLDCLNDGECMGMQKICKSCGKPVNVDKIVKSVACDHEGSTMQQWCKMQESVVCEMNPGAKYCPIWFRAQWLTERSSPIDSGKHFLSSVLGEAKENLEEPLNFFSSNIEQVEVETSIRNVTNGLQGFLESLASGLKSLFQLPGNGTKTASVASENGPFDSFFNLFKT